MIGVALFLALACTVSCFDKEVDEQFRKLPHDEFVKYFNSQNFTYKIAHYDGIDKKAVHCATPREYHFIPVIVNNTISGMSFAPPEFNGAESWEHCYQVPIDQEECTACWAIATATVASIRTCLLGPLPIPVPIPIEHTNQDGPHPLLLRGLAPFDLNCCKDCYNQTEGFCGEGSPEKAALFWLKNGIVTNLCKPFDLHFYNNETSCKEECVMDALYYHADKHFGSRVTMLLKSDHEIRREIYERGPVVATFILYEDFKDYKEGVYEHTHGNEVGHHSVVVVGYGEENGVPYWLAANTWGYEWGQTGLFKVKRFTQDLAFEDRMLSLLPRYIL